MRTGIPDEFDATPTLLRLLAIVASLLLMVSFALARDKADATDKPKPYALIFGTVWDPDGHPLYGVTVKIRRSDEKKTRWELYSNHAGEFAQRVPAGKADYVVWADLTGYKLPPGKRLKAAPEVTVHIEAEERSDIGLHLDW